MKKLSKKISFLFIPILLVTFIYSSCNDSNETVSDLEIDTQKIEKLLGEYKPSLKEKSTKLSDTQVINFEVVKNLKTGEIFITNEEIVDFFPVDEKSAYMKASGSYTVSCDRGGTGSQNWTKNCDGKWSCGSLVAKCLKEGGCATMCAIKSSERLYSSVLMTYIP